MSKDNEGNALFQMSGDLHKEIELMQKRIENRGKLIDNMHTQIKNNERILELLYVHILQQAEIVKNAKRDENGNVYFDTPEEEEQYKKAYELVHLDITPFIEYQKKPDENVEKKMEEWKKEYFKDNS